MANPFYNASGYPAPNAPGASLNARNEFSNIGAAFDKMPTLTALSFIRVNAAGTALESFTPAAADLSTALAGYLLSATATSTYLGINANAASATKLATPRAINGVNFDGTAAITIADATKLPLTGGTLSAQLTISQAIAAPLTTGSAANGYQRLVDSAGSRVLDFGVSSIAAWLQSRDKNDYTVDYDLLIQPNGGNVGIGMTPVQVLDITKANASTAAVQVLNTNNGTGAASGFIAKNDVGDFTQWLSTGSGYTAYPLAGARCGLLISGGTGGLVVNAAAGTLRFAAGGGTEQMRLDANGFLGIGRTPTAGWAGGNGTFRGIELGQGTGTSAIFGQTNTNALYLATNYYYDGVTGRYAGAAQVAHLRLFNDGSNCFTFSGAAGGVANAAVTLSTLMTISAAGVIADGAGNELGYKGLPMRFTAGADTLTTADRGKSVIINAAAAVTIPSGVFTTGDVVTIGNNIGSAQSILQGAGLNLRLAGTSNTGNRVIANQGLVTVLFLNGSIGVISGAGLS